MSDKIKIILIIAFAALLLWGLFFVAWPKWQKIGDAKAQFATKENEIIQRIEMIDKITDFLANFPKIESEAEKALLAVPLGQEIPEVILQIDAMALQNGLVVKNIGFSKKEDPKLAGLKALNISANLSGSYQAIKNFVLAIEQNARLMDIANLNFNQDGEIPNRFNLSASINAYYK